MRDLSIAQRFFICGVNKNGTISSFDTRTWPCFVVSAVMDLRLAGAVRMTADRNPVITVTGPLPANLSHIAPLYEFLDGKHSIKLAKLIEQYIMSFTAKLRNALFDAVGSSLADLNAATPHRSGLLSRTTGYVPAVEVTNQVVDTIRTELFELDGNPATTEDTVVLTALLDRAKLLRRYFSPHERKQLASVIKQCAASPTGVQTKKAISDIETLITIIAVMPAVTSSAH